MKIGMMTRWNVPCGVAAHAEPVGRAWVEMGHDLKVFAPVEWNAPQTQEDEPYVVRCYRLNSGWRKKEGFFFDPAPFVEDSFDIFVVQNLELMPMPELFEIYPIIRERARTVLVVHEGGPPTDSDFYKFQWDAIVSFDDRYREFLSPLFPGQRIEIVPYPCHPLSKGDKYDARLRLNLPQDRKIIFNYGLGVFRHLHLLPTVERLSKRYPILFLTLTDVEDWFELFAGLQGRYEFLETRKGPVSTEELYAYLHASDALVIHKDTSAAVVVSSTAYLCLGSGCPILAYDTNFFETLGDEVIKYRSLEELAQRLEDIFEGKENVGRTLETAEKYVSENSGWEIGKTFVTLFESLRAEHIKVEMLIGEPEVAAVSPASVAVLPGLTQEPQIPYAPAELEESSAGKIEPAISPN